MTAVIYETEYPGDNANIENVDLLHDSNKSQEAIIEHLRHQLLELSIERNSLRHQQNDALEEVTLQKKALEEQLESVKESHKSALAHWQKKCSSLKVEVISLEKRLGVLDGQRQVDPDGQCAADYDITAITEIHAKYKAKLQQLNYHIVLLNSEVEFWKAEHDKVKMKYDTAIISKRRAECDSIGSKGVIESMRNEIERLNRQSAEKEKQLHSQKKNKIFSSSMKKKKRDTAKECAHALSLDDVKTIYPCNDFSETPQSSKARHFSENPFHSVRSDDEKDDSSEVRSSCRDSFMEVASPTRSMKSTDTDHTFSMTSFDTDPARSMISTDTNRIPSSDVDDTLKSSLSSRKTSTTYHPLPDQIPSPTTFTGELQSCLVSRMPYKDKQSCVDGIYTGHIDVATKLPNGNGMLKCMNGDVLSGEWRFGVLQ
eukprot:CCRYP_017234-RA/>CCRYP_017234-RA protein AED:0.43 eAED:0.43 QI:0/-1/0/1/-1/1/1/0/427